MIHPAISLHAASTLGGRYAVRLPARWFVDMFFGMGCFTSSAREGPREPHLNRASPEAIAASNNTAQQRSAAREIFHAAEKGWICDVCEHYNRGKHSKRTKCHHCQKASKDAQTVRVFDTRDTAEDMRENGLTTRCGWYHTVCGRHHGSMGDSQVCASPECGGDGGDIKYTCEDENAG